MKLIDSRSLFAAVSLLAASAFASDGDLFLPLEKNVNVGLVDEVAGDKKGGWHDMGPDQDGRNFPIRRKEFAGVPFKLIDPETNNGKSVILFAGDHADWGVRNASVPLSEPSNAKYLYLLHFSAWGNPADKVIGRIEFVSQSGKSSTVDIMPNQDISDWFAPREKKNAVLGAVFPSASSSCGVFVSKFYVPKDLLPLKEVVFRHPEESGTLWLLLGATLSSRDLPVKQLPFYEIKPDDVWKPVKTLSACGKPGTALDFSNLFPKHKSGEFGRIVQEGSHSYVFEKKPHEPLRFMIYTSQYMSLPTKEDADKFVEFMDRSGYNMWRVWIGYLFNGNNIEPEANRLDVFFYTVSKMKERGMYLLYSAVMPGNVYTEPDSRSLWFSRIASVLCKNNPYTGMRLMDDPVLAFIDCNNELEFTVSRAKSVDFTNEWRRFLVKKYNNNIGHLMYTWGISGLRNFDDITMFTPRSDNSPLHRDQNEFLSGLEGGFTREEVLFLRNLGFKGGISSFLTNGSMRYCMIRQKNFDVVFKNTYHDHPMDWSSTNHTSSIESGANCVLAVCAFRLYGKPLVVTEHGHGFWNRYRYEQGFVTGGYAALNGFSGLTAFASPMLPPEQPITCFAIGNDPVIRASEYLTALIFRRGDVKEADSSVRVRVDSTQLETMNYQGVNISQMKLGFVARAFLDFTSVPAAKNEIVSDLFGAVDISVQDWFTRAKSVSSEFDVDKFLSEMKKQKLIPENNATNARKGVYESMTGEILMKQRELFMQINTPRLQGICGESGTNAKLPNFEIISMNRRGNLALASIDADKPLDSAKRMLLIVSTNAMNNGMIFEEREMLRYKSGRWPKNRGCAPVLLETGLFDLAVRSSRAAHLKLYALRVDGTRMTEIPMERTGDVLRIHLDTAALPDATVYFELAEK